MVRIKSRRDRDEESEALTTDVDVLKERYDDVEKLKTSSNWFGKLWRRLIHTLTGDEVFIPVFVMTAISRLIYFTAPALILAY